MKNYTYLDCDIIAGPPEAGVKVATAESPEIARWLSNAANAYVEKDQARVLNVALDVEGSISVEGIQFTFSFIKGMLQHGLRRDTPILYSIVREEDVLHIHEFNTPASAESYFLNHSANRVKEDAAQPELPFDTVQSKIAEVVATGSTDADPSNQTPDPSDA